MTIETPEGLALIRGRLAADHHLAVLVTTDPGRNDPQVSVVNLSVITHPVAGNQVIAFVGRRGAKLVNLRRNPHATLVIRSGWEWVAISGPVELSGPDDPHPGIDNERQRLLLRDIYTAAGGQHPDLTTYDETVLAERRCAVLIQPDRIWSNPAGSEHLEPEDTQ